MAKVNGIDLVFKTIPETTHKALIDGDEVIPFAGPDGTFYYITRDELFSQMGGFTSGFQGELAIADTPIEDGMYMPTESGNYTNAGGIVVDMSAGVTFIVKKDGNYYDVVYPIDLSAVDAIEGQVAELDLIIEGGDVDDGVADPSSSYSVNISSVSSKINARPITREGNIINFTVSVGVVGNGNFTFLVFRPIGGDKIKCIGKHSAVATTTGLNSFNLTNPIAVQPGDLLGVTIEAGGMVTSAKSKSDGGLYVITTNPQIGTEYAITVIYQYEWYITCQIQVDGVRPKIDYLDENSIKTDDLTIDVSQNNAIMDIAPDANSAGITLDAYINSTGGKSAGAGWVMMGIPVLAGEVRTLSNFTTGAFPIFYAYYKTNGSTISSGNYGTINALPFTVPAAPEDGFLFFDLVRPGAATPDYDEVMVNIGNTPLPYQPPGSEITAIRGYDIRGGGGEQYDQALNTFDNVEFAGLTITALSLELPEGSGTPPSGVEVGDAWLDTSESASNPPIKVRRS